MSTQNASAVSVAHQPAPVCRLVPVMLGAAKTRRFFLGSLGVGSTNAFIDPQQDFSSTRFGPPWSTVGAGPPPPPTHRCVLPRRIPTPVCLEQGSDAGDGVGRINLKTSTGISALVGEGSTGVTHATCFVAVGPLGGKPPFRTSTTHTILHICHHGDGPWEDVMQDSPASSVLAMWAPKPVKGWL